MPLNQDIATVLRDFAAIQRSKEKSWAYQRAAAAVDALNAPLDTLLRPDGTLTPIANIGPSSSKIIVEILTTGTSATIEAAISGHKEPDIDEAKGQTHRFLSREQVAAALRDAKLGGPRLEDYRGDLQMHSVYSDGKQTLRDIVETGIAREYAYCAVTDHSYGLPIAHGLSMARLAKQHEEIDVLNREFRGRFRLLKGIEANIGPNGSVDMKPDELRRLEIVVAAPHSGLRSTADQTRRILGAVNTPGVHILGHPRGRRYGLRPGITADWKRVFTEAAKSGIAIEIDGDPRRQDIDFHLAKSALDAGCLFALDSDGHATRELAFAETAIAHARLAGIPKDRIINCWPLKRLLAWAQARSRAIGP